MQFRLQLYRSVKSVHDGTPIAETEVKPLSWAEHIAPFVIRHKTSGELYFQLKPERIRELMLTVDGQKATQTQLIELKSFLRAPSEGPTWRSVKLDNIYRLAIDHSVFEKSGNVVD